MDTARFVVALIAIDLFPPSLIYWLIIHSLTRALRKKGLVFSYANKEDVLVGWLFGIACQCFDPKS